MGTTIDYSYLSSVSLFEVWLVLLFAIVVLVARYTSFLLPVVLICLSTTFLFATIMVIAIVITFMAPDGFKKNILLPLIHYGLALNCPIRIWNHGILEKRKTMVLCNYPSNFIEYLQIPIVCSRLNCSFTIITLSKAGKWAKMFLDSDCVFSLPHSANNFDILKYEIQKLVENDTLPIIYPERNFKRRRNFNEILDFRTGVLQIAKELNIAVVIATVDHIRHIGGIVQNNEFNIRFEQCNTYDATDAKAHMDSMLNGKYEWKNEIIK